MKVSTLIAKLAVLQDQYGNVDVFIGDTSSHIPVPVGGVAFERKWGAGQLQMPDAIILHSTETEE